MFLPAATVIASIFYSLILRVCQPQGEAYKFQFAEYIFRYLIKFSSGTEETIFCGGLVLSLLSLWSGTSGGILVKLFYT
jgi:hypothetical protein